MAGRVVPGVGLLDGTADYLVDAVAELAREQDRNQGWRVWADKLTALAATRPAVVADGAFIESVPT
jgi:hypothetical protein